jgi:3-dehydroquinate synthase
MTKITLTATGKYDILVENGLLRETGALTRSVSKALKAAVITDSTVADLYAEAVIRSLEAAGFETKLFVFSAGESSKTHATLLNIYSFLAESDITRTDIIVALGGGVTGDMAGFAAATFLRGIDFIQVPTTLLAQMDSSIGGKTGVDLVQGKNLVGAFYQPRLVICDPAALKTLTPRIFNDGMAEVVKHGCIKDVNLFEKINSANQMDDIIFDMICRSIEIKRDVVENDEKEKGERMLLNFGHTMGHAIEKVYNFGTYTHGEAVAMGMVLASRAGELNGITQGGTTERIKSLLSKLQLPVECRVAVKELAKAAINDKKRSGDIINLVMLKQLGEGYTLKLPVTELERFFSGGAKL